MRAWCSSVKPHMARRNFIACAQRISRALIEKKQFNFVAIEGDWPDAARIDHLYAIASIRPLNGSHCSFPNLDVAQQRSTGIRRLAPDYNASLKSELRVAFHGLDLYSMYNSIRSVLRYLDDVDPEFARVARERYGCLTPWQSDPAIYGHAALTGSYRTCEKDVIGALKDLLKSTVLTLCMMVNVFSMPFRTLG